MVKRVQTIETLEDDLDGSKADRTVLFAFDGKSYEIDLSKKNATAFEKAVAPYIAAARRTARNGRSRSNPGGSQRGRQRSDLAAVREWARANGLEVSERGRVARSVQDAYDAAH